MQKKKQESAELNRLKSEFLNNISHEIRTPLNGVIGMTDCLLDTALDEKQRFFAETIKSSTASLLKLTDTILTFSKAVSGIIKLEKLDFRLSGLLAGIAKSISGSAEKKGVGYSWHIEGSVPDLLYGDRTRLGQVVMNLAENAIKFTREGTITLFVSPEKLTDEEAVLRFSISDTGIGIPAEKKSAIFEAFSQADTSSTRMYEGLGLGLALSKELVKLMGGEIGVESLENRGSTFWFTATFPLPSPPEKPGTVQAEEKQSRLNDKCRATTPQYQSMLPENQQTPPPPGKQPRILVVEDNIINQQVVLMMLKKSGLPADVAANGKEAIEAVEKQHYDLVFMDIQMPEMDGLEATRQIRKKSCGDTIPIVALTAHTLKEDREKCFEVGMNDFISKPLNAAELAKILKTWLQ